MPDNFLNIGLIKTLFPNARIINCERNPLDICTSIYLNYFPLGNEYSFNLIELGRYYKDYERLMNHWQNIFSSEIFNVEYEKLIFDQEKTIRQLIEYLGLDWDDNCLNFQINKRAVRTASNLQIRKPIYTESINRWKNYEKHLAPLISILSE